MRRVGWVTVFTALVGCHALIELDRFTGGRGGEGGVSSSQGGMNNQGGATSTGGGGAGGMGPEDWVVSLSGPPVLRVTDVAIDDQGNSYITGIFQGGDLELPPDGGGTAVEISRNSDTEMAFLFSLSATGSTRWAHAMQVHTGGNTEDRIPHPQVAWAPGPDEGGSLFYATTFNDTATLPPNTTWDHEGNGDILLVRWNATTGLVETSLPFSQTGANWVTDLAVRYEEQTPTLYLLSGFRFEDLVGFDTILAGSDVAVSVHGADLQILTETDMVTPIVQRLVVDNDGHRVWADRVAYGDGRLCVTGTYRGSSVHGYPGDQGFWVDAGGTRDVWLWCLDPDTLAPGSPALNAGNNRSQRVSSLAVDASRTVLGMTLGGTLDLPAAGTTTVPIDVQGTQLFDVSFTDGGSGFITSAGAVRTWSQLPDTPDLDAGSLLSTFDGPAYVVAGTVRGNVVPVATDIGTDTSGIIAWFDEDGAPGEASSGSPTRSTLLGDATSVQTVDALAARDGVVLVAGSVEGTIDQLEPFGAGRVTVPEGPGVFIARVRR